MPYPLRFFVCAHYPMTDAQKQICKEQGLNLIFPDAIIDINEPEPDAVYDAAFVFNHALNNIVLNVREGNVYCVMQEPGDFLLNPYMYFGLNQYDLLISPIRGFIQKSKFKPSHGYQSTFIESPPHTYPAKTKPVSCIMSSLKVLPGHRLRFAFGEYLKTTNLPINFFGKHTNPINSKADGLIPYHYSVAIENSSMPFYFTEKINDCFACYTIPFYYGCTNIQKFFPEKSYVWIDINNPKQAVKKMRDTLELEDPKDRLDAVTEARRLVLEEYLGIGFYRSIQVRMEGNFSNPVTKRTLYDIPKMLSDKYTWPRLYILFKVLSFFYKLKLKLKYFFIK